MNSEFTAEFLVVSSLLSPTLCPLLSEKVGIELHLYQAESSRNSGSTLSTDKWDRNYYNYHNFHLDKYIGEAQIISIMVISVLLS